MARRGRAGGSQPWQWPRGTERQRTHGRSPQALPKAPGSQSQWVQEELRGGGGGARRPWLGHGSRCPSRVQPSRPATGVPGHLLLNHF